MTEHELKMATETIAQILKGWRRDIRLLDRSRAPRPKMEIRVCAWNWATSPTALRTDQEHRACRRFAIRVRRELGQYTGWYESESGRLWVS